jgi:hypothetical protein
MLHQGGLAFFIGKPIFDLVSRELNWERREKSALEFFILLRLADKRGVMPSAIV